MQDTPHAAEDTQWVIWNGYFGILDLVTIGQTETGPAGRLAWLEEPYDMVGPFNLDELEANGQIGFEACVVMSRQKWQENQVELRREAHANRRAAQEKLYEYQARYNQGRTQHPSSPGAPSDHQHRKVLNLPVDGNLEPKQIKAAFRRLAQKAHPDMGGNHEQFVRITEARDALLARAS